MFNLVFEDLRSNVFSTFVPGYLCSLMHSLERVLGKCTLGVVLVNELHINIQKTEILKIQSSILRVLVCNISSLNLFLKISLQESRWNISLNKLWLLLQKISIATYSNQLCLCTDLLPRSLFNRILFPYKTMFWHSIIFILYSRGLQTPFWWADAALKEPLFGRWQASGPLDIAGMGSTKLCSVCVQRVLGCNPTLTKCHRSARCINAGMRHSTPTLMLPCWHWCCVQCQH